MLIEENCVDGAADVYVGKDGLIRVGDGVYTKPVLWRDGAVEVLNIDMPSELSPENMLPDDDGDLPEVVIVGTGGKQIFVPPKIMAAFARYGIGVECMNTDSACRTLALLRGDGRKVWAWLFQTA